MFISVPSLIQQIKLLEQEVGSPLFYRNVRGISLTPAGASFRATAFQILDTYERGLADIANLTKENKQEIRIGVDLSDIAPYMGELCMSFKKEFPSVDVSFIAVRFIDQKKALQNHMIDLYNSGEEKDITDGFSFFPVYEDEMYAVMSPESRLCGKEEIALSDLQGYRVFLEEAFEKQSNSITQNILKQKLDIEVDHSPFTNSMILEVHMNKAILPCPESWLKNYCPPLEARIIPGYRRIFGFMCLSEPDPVVINFLEYAKAFIAKNCCL